jgi:hypothetical protein
MQQWIPVTGIFLTGMLVGALALAAAERHLWQTAAPDIQSADDGGVTAHSHAPAGPGSAEGPGRAMDADARETETRWVAINDALALLNERVMALETRLADAAPTGPVEDATTGALPAADMDQATLVAAGLDVGRAADILQRQSRLEMQRLELRDRASREGWSDSERFFEAMRELNGDVESLRAEIGDEAYDRFLYLTGQSNRVVIASIIDDSPAQLAGLQAGDVVMDYADGRIFSWVDLRDATRAGQRDEYVLLRVQRDDQLLELSVPRGPLGVRMDTEQIDPDANG